MAGEARPVRPGIDVVLSDSLHLLRGRRIGLITNQTGVGRGGTSGIDLLWEHPEVELVALFSPEHGIRGDAPEGEIIEEEVDSATGLVVHSLYGETRAPTSEMLEGIDVLLFDIQDVGARYFTYVSTMALAMEAAAPEDIHFVVLDRPNPIGGVQLQGNVLQPSFSSFMGMFRIAMRHGMTPGELARMSRDAGALDVELTVVPADGWRRSMAFDDTGLPWIPPSPNMPTVRTALHYPGTCLFEGTSLSVGRGTDRPFEQVGAPWLDGPELARRLEARDLPGVRFEAVRFTPRDPTDGKHDGVEVSGVRFVARGPDYDPTMAAVAALFEARHMAGERWEWRPDHFDLLAGTDRLRIGIDEGRTVEELTADWDAQLREYRQHREPHLIYEP
ncbi:MAG: exo-beta-N-acetylmuramidase NamZ domain-containing protein [Gemmatimonadota bacterium]